MGWNVSFQMRHFLLRLLEQPDRSCCTTINVNKIVYNNINIIVGCIIMKCVWQVHVYRVTATQKTIKKNLTKILFSWLSSPLIILVHVYQVLYFFYIGFRWTAYVIKTYNERMLKCIKCTTQAKQKQTTPACCLLHFSSWGSYESVNITLFKW